MAHLLQQVVIWCSRLSNLGDVAIPLHDKKNYVQKKITDFFSIKRAPVVGKTVKVQQKLTKYFSMRPKVRRPGAAAPRHHHRRHPSHHHHPSPAASVSHSITSQSSLPPLAVALFPLGKVRVYRIVDITPIRASIDPYM